jgi:hypothetical protein
MEINPKKTKIMVVNGSVEDGTPIKTETFDISYTPHYVYLGAHFTDHAKNFHKSTNLPVSSTKTKTCRTQ